MHKCAPALDRHEVAVPDEDAGRRRLPNNRSSTSVKLMSTVVDADNFIKELKLQTTEGLGGNDPLLGTYAFSLSRSRTSSPTTDSPGNAHANTNTGGSTSSKKRRRINSASSLGNTVQSASAAANLCQSGAFDDTDTAFGDLTSFVQRHQVFLRHLAKGAVFLNVALLFRSLV